MKSRTSHLSLLAAVLLTALSFDLVRADSPTKPAPSVQKIVPAAHPAAASGKDSGSAVRTLPAAVLKTQVPAGGPSARGSIKGPVLANCATGFNKTAEHKQVETGALDRFECTTPVITCPHNPVYQLASLEVEIINTNPEQSAKQIRYTCTYYPAVP